MRTPFRIVALLAFGACGAALAQTQPPAPARPASSARAAVTAPTSDVTRILQDTRPDADDKRQDNATPQVAIPLRKAAPNAIALKPGKPERATGGVDDAAARCQAQTSAAARAKCATP